MRSSKAVFHVCTAVLFHSFHLPALAAEASLEQPSLSLAGIWTPVADASEGSQMINLAGIRYEPITLADGRFGLVFNGFAFNPNPNPALHKVNAHAVTRMSDGRLQSATSSVLGDPVNNGSADVVVGDLNGDGVDDILIVGHNEAPDTPVPSTAWLSTSDGRLSKTIIDDLASVHGATLTTLNGRPTVVGANLSTIIGDPNPYYQYEDGTLKRTAIMGFPYQGRPNSSFNAEDFAFGDFAGDGTQYVVAPNNTFGPSHNTPGLTKITLYKFSDVLSNTGRPALVLPGYFEGRSEYKDLRSLWGAGVSDLPRVWTDDFNHDGKLDFTNIASLWPTNLWTLQMHQNSSTGGALAFQDRGTSFWPVDIRIPYLDYSMQLADIDGSGINSYLFAGSVGTANPAMQTNYILLNDGTGKLHVYYHDQFAALAQKVQTHLSSEHGFQFIAGMSSQPGFIAYPAGNGKLNLLAVQSVVDTKVQPQVFRFYLVNVEVNADPAVDFRQNITISDRNSSQRIRTWAGDDLVRDAGASSQLTTINGGAGVDKAVYSGAYSQYTVERGSGGTLTVQGNGVHDRLTGVERLEFAGSVVDVSQAPPFDSRVVFDFAASRYPELFGGTPTFGTYLQYTYAYFPATNSYLGIDPLGGIWLLGPSTGGSLAFVGFESAFTSVINAWRATR